MFQNREEAGWWSKVNEKERRKGGPGSAGG